jgi:hypothetical protein
LLTPAAREAWSGQLAAGDPSLKGKSCPALIASGAFGDPADQPPAIDEASTFVFKRIAVGPNGTATLTFPDGRRWRLVKSGSRWLIADLPFVPPSLSTTQTA